MTDNLRFPRKMKKVMKKETPDEWLKFLRYRKEHKARAEHIDNIFTRDYENARHTLRKMMKHGR